MSPAIRTPLRLVLAGLLVALVAPIRSQADHPELPAELRAARERWEELTPRERDRVRAAYESWQKLDAEQRAELERRAQRLQEMRERVQRELPADVKRDLSQLDGRKQRQVLRDLTEVEAEEKGRRIRAKMPEDFVRRLREAPADKRPELLRRFKRTQRGRVARAALETLGRQLELPAAEIQRLQGLPEDQRARAVLELRQELAQRNVQEEGLPHGLSWEQWDRWSRLPPDQFFERLVEYRTRRIGELAHPEDPVQPPQAQGPVATPTPAPAPDGGNAAPPAQEPLSRVLRRLAEAVKPDPRDALELIELSRPERKAGMARRRRQRCMQLIQSQHLLPAERVRELEDLDDEPFFDVIRRILTHAGYMGPEEPERAAEPR
jgi:Protein of unknown function (DUF3106)